MFRRQSVFALSLALAFAPLALGQQDYFGTLKPPPQSSLSPTGVYSLQTSSLLDQPVAFGLDSGTRTKLGYKASRYFAVETEFAEFRTPAELFASPGNLASQFRSTGFGVDTIAMFPWRSFSVYGRMGAYRGDGRGGFGYGSSALLPDQLTRGSRWRYGMGVRYDFTTSFGVRADLERTSPVGSSLLTEVDAGDQFSVGLSWRF